MSAGPAQQASGVQRLRPGRPQLHAAADARERSRVCAPVAAAHARRHSDAFCNARTVRASCRRCVRKRRCGKRPWPMHRARGNAIWKPRGPAVRARKSLPEAAGCRIAHLPLGAARRSDDHSRARRAASVAPSRSGHGCGARPGPDDAVAVPRAAASRARLAPRPAPGRSRPRRVHPAGARVGCRRCRVAAARPARLTAPLSGRGRRQRVRSDMRAGTAETDARELRLLHQHGLAELHALRQLHSGAFRRMVRARSGARARRRGRRARPSSLRARRTRRCRAVRAAPTHSSSRRTRRRA